MVIEHVFFYNTCIYTLGFIKFETKFRSWGAGHLAAPFIESTGFKTINFHHGSWDYWELCCCSDRIYPLSIQSRAVDHCRYVILNHDELINWVVWYNKFDGFCCTVYRFCFLVSTQTLSNITTTSLTRVSNTMYSLYLLLFYSTINFNIAIIQAILPQAVLSGFDVHPASHVTQLVIVSFRYVLSLHGSGIIALQLAKISGR